MLAEERAFLTRGFCVYPLMAEKNKKGPHDLNF